MKTKKFSVWVLGALLVLSGGCTTVKLYSGEKPDNEIAIVRPSGEVMIFRMNEQKTPRILQQAGYRFSEGRVMKLLPGFYTANCRAFNDGWESVNNFDVLFPVQAGKEYYMHITGNGRSRMGIAVREVK